MIVAAGSPELGVDVYAQNWRPDLPVPDEMRRVFTQPQLISDKIIEAVGKNSGDICDSIKKQVTVSNLVGDGITIKADKFVCTLGKVTDLNASAGRDDVVIDFVLKGNQFDIETTQPTIFGSDQDPTFIVVIDVQVHLFFKWDASGKLTLTAAKQNVVNNVVPPIGTNVAGRVAFLLDAISGFARSKQFESSIVRSVGNSRGLSSSLRAMFDSVQMPTPPAFPTMQFRLVQVVVNGNRLKFGFKVELVSNPNLSGTLGGAVRWPSQLAAENGCGSFKVTAKTQYLPREFRGFDKPMGPATMIEREAFFNLGAQTLPDGRSECRYRIDGLPTGHSTEVKAAPPQLVDAQARTGIGAGARFSVPLLSAAGWASPLVVNGQSNVDFDVFVRTIPGVKALARPQTPLDQKAQPVTGLRAPFQPGNAPQPPHGPTDRVQMQATPQVQAGSKPAVTKVKKALARPDEGKAAVNASAQKLIEGPAANEVTAPVKR